MSKRTREWIGVAAFAGVAVLFVAFAIWTAPKDDCRPDPAKKVFSLIIGGSMLLAGCAP